MKPKVSKPFKAELGSVNPWIYVPGKWSPKELEAHARMAFPIFFWDLCAAV